MNAVYLYYNDDLSLSKIAEYTGFTCQGVRDSIKRCEQQLFEYEKKLGLLSRFQQLEQGLEEILSLAGQIVRSTDDTQLRSLAAQIADKAGALKEKD